MELTSELTLERTNEIYKGDTCNFEVGKPLVIHLLTSPKTLCINKTFGHYMWMC